MSARPRFSADPKLPSCFASNPPPTLVIPTSTRVSPINVTTMPVTKGVMMRLAQRMKGLKTIGTSAATRHTPNTAPKASCCEPPALNTDWASAMMGPKNTKLVP